MSVLILNQEEVRDLLTMEACIQAVASAFASRASGAVHQPVRTVFPTPEGNALAMMPTYDVDLGSLGVKVITVFPGNHGTHRDAHQGVVLVFDSQHGSLEAIVDATAITAIRTAAASAVATRYLANEDAATVAILGAGTQALSHLEAMALVRRIQAARVWGIAPGEADRFVERCRGRYDFDVTAAGDARTAVVGAQIVCTTTPARTPILERDWLSPGVHINAIGACSAVTRELDTATVRSAEVYVDSMDAAFKEAGDIVIPIKEGAIADSHVRGELSQIVAGTIRGRSNRDSITLFKAVGQAFEDLASARAVVDLARRSAAGTSVPIGGRHFADT